MRGAALLLVALTLTGCETSAEKSAKLEREARRQAAVAQRSQTGLSVTRQSTSVKVVDATVVRSSEGAAAAVTVRNVSARTLRAVPIAITVKDARGQTLFQNDAAGLEAGLTSIGSLPAHGEATWVDDQIPQSGEPTSVSARVGEAPPRTGPTPQIEIEGLRPSEEPTGGAAGTVRNRSRIAQRKLVVYVLARRAGRIVAAGRAVLPEVAPGTSAPFQVFLVGAAAGAKLQASAPPTTFD